MITRQFLEEEIRNIEAELERARVFIIQAQAVMDSYKMLISKFDEPVEAVEAEADQRIIQE